MELFVPSILILLLAAILSFGVFPNMPPFVLALIAILLLVVVGYNHHLTFKDEYAMSTWQDSIYNAATPFFSAVIAIFMIGFLLNFFGGRKANAPAAPAGATPPVLSQNFTTTQRKAIESLIRNP